MKNDTKNSARKPITAILFAAMMIVSLLAITPTAQANMHPEVICVPFGPSPAEPHDTWSGNQVILKGTAHDPDGDAELATYKWDFGDGTNITGTVTNPYVIEAKHTYTGPIGKIFTATLTVWDTHGASGSDNYLVEIKNKTLDVEVNDATDDMLWWLHKTQTRGTYADGAPYGYWQSASNMHVGFTGAAVEAFEINGHCLSGDPSEDPYIDTVQRGLNYLLANTKSQSIGIQEGNNPDTNGNGIGLVSYTGRQMYETGIALMAISSSQTPNKIADTGGANVKGRAYKDIAQDMVDFIAWGQNDPSTGVYRGGWRYNANYGQSDNSVSQWPVIGMEAAVRNFNSTVPGFVKSELLKWLAYSQCHTGGFGYTSPCSWTNTAKTGAGCAMLNFSGVPTSDSRFLNALNFLNTNWYVTSSTYTNFGDYYSMYGIMKGMRVPDPDVEKIGTHDWYAEYARYIVDDVNTHGGEHVDDISWLSSYVDNYNYALSTAWAVLTLNKEVVKPGPVAEAGPDVHNHPPLINITFDGSGSYHANPAKTIVLYEWEFGDGTNAAGKIVTHAYPAYYNPDGSINWTLTAQNYTVTLKVTDDSTPSMSDTDTCVVHITAPPWKPVADANGPYEGYKREPICFNGSGSYDPEEKMYPPTHPWYENISKYEWDLDGDGEYDDANEANPVWTWDHKGVYSVGLRVTDSQPSGPGGTYGDLDIDIDYVIVVVKNRPPVADCGGPYYMAPDLTVNFDGSGSYDPDNDTLCYRWDFESDGTYDTSWSLSPYANFTYPVFKEYNVTLEVYDGQGGYNTSICAVYPNIPPVANAGPDQTVEQTYYQGANVTLNGSGSYDLNNDPLTYNWTWTGGSATGVSPIVSLPLGNTTITLVVNDGTVDSDPDTVNITVVDTTPPDITVTVTPDTLWPPNHKMVDIVATVTVSDICDAAPTVVLTSLTSNEPDDAKGNGDGNTVNDIQEAEIGTEDYEFQLRAERAGKGDGRVYTITYTVTDASGNSASASATVVVPHDMG